MIEDFAARLQRATKLRVTGDHDAARALLINLALERPEDARTQLETAWVYDAIGLEDAAIPYYERALALGLNDPADCANAHIGLGSSYRTLERYEQARRVLLAAKGLFPANRAVDVFLAMVLHNLGDHAEAMRLLLLVIADTSSNDDIKFYSRAINFYAGQMVRIRPNADAGPQP